MSLWIYLIIFITITILSFGIYYLLIEGGTTEIQNGNFNNQIGNEIIKESIDLKNYILRAQEKVSKIITEDIVIPLTIRRYPLGANILAQASMRDKNNIRAGGSIIINTVSLSDPERWINIIVHEIFHVLGLGSSEKWEDGVINIDGHNYLDRELFPRSGSKYDLFIRNGLVVGNIGDHIPLSDNQDSFPDGGAHLDENIFDIEVMTPIADDDNVISSLTIAILEDLGFEVDYHYNEDYLL